MLDTIKTLNFNFKCSFPFPLNSQVYCVEIFVLIRVFMSAQERHILKFNQHKQYSNESRVTETDLKTSMFASEFNFVKCVLHVCVPVI